MLVDILTDIYQMGIMFAFGFSVAVVLMMGRRK